MKRRHPKRAFDGVGFKRKVQAEIYQEIEGLSAEEEIEYFRRSAAHGPLGVWWKALESHWRSIAGEVASSAPGDSKHRRMLLLTVLPRDQRGSPS
jgi:hypothetical protein